ADAAVGIGAGWTFPEEILRPNTVSARLRFGKFAIEPGVSLGGGGSGNKATSTRTIEGQPPVESSSENRAGDIDLSVGANVGYRLARRGPVDLAAIGGVSLGFGNETENLGVDDPANPHTVRTSTFSAALSWGIGVEWFFAKHLGLSASATNPLLGYSSTSTREDETQTTGGANPTTITTVTQGSTGGTTIGVVFRPTVRAMFHLYF
ncbi:MAG: outer membrane beta-barrel protein, partial [Myxococcota bacterium]